MVSIFVEISQYLRRSGRCDVKQMCAEGGCGICTIIELKTVNGKGVGLEFNNKNLINYMFSPKVFKLY